jgi:glycosyltransferase involved in cell wall biosynthesis
MRDKPPLSILIPWYERDELRLTLAANASVFRAHDAEILILNCGGSSECLRGLITASEVTGVRQLDISVPGFNKSLALNVGLARARADTVFTLDADIVLLGPLPVDAMDERSFLTIESVYESATFNAKEAPSHSTVASARSAFVEFTFRGGVKVRHQASLFDPFGNVRISPPGLLLTKKGDLLNIQGYNSDLESWGWEDDDVLIRLQYALGRRRVQSGSALHLTHGDNARFLRRSRSQSGQRNFIKCCRNYNNGLFFGTYHSDIARLSDNVTETVVDSPRPGRMAGDG